MKNKAMHQYIYLLIMTIAMSLVGIGNATAAEKDKSARRAAIMMQKIKQDMQTQIDADKATMQAQLDAQKKESEEKLKIKEDEIATINKKLAATESKNKNLLRDLTKTTAEKMALDSKLQQTQAELDTTQKNLGEIQTQHAQALTDLKFNDGQRKTLATNLAQSNKTMNECTIKNGKLYQFGTELIQLYEKPSTYEAAMRKEQFFQLKRVELENILQSKQDSLDEARYVNKKTNY